MASLLDGLVGEGPLPAPGNSEVWFALRTDGVRGSGTESDPYDGSPRYETSRSLTNLELSGVTGREREAIATTSGAHGYENGNVVTVAGVTGADGQFYNGTFVIYGKTATTFKYWMKGIPDGDAAGTITCARTSFLFDDIRAAMGSDVTIHVGPGVFLTKGHPIMSVFSGHKIVGSGMQATTVRLVAMVESGETFRAFGSNDHLQSFEVSDLTIDCNLPAGIAFPPMNCGAINCRGDHLRYRRVRAINFGTLREGHECFVLASGGSNPDQGDAVDCVIEDCIVEQPALNSAYQTTCIIMSGGERSSDGVMAWNRACAIRNCVVDGEYKLNPVPISGISVSGTTATVTTAIPHGRATNQWVRISGAKVSGAESNLLNGAFPITYLSAITFQYTLTDTSSNPTGEMWVDRFPSHRIPITSISKYGNVVTVGTPTPHFRALGDNVVIVSDDVTPQNKFVGCFEVIDVVDPTHFKYSAGQDPGIWSGQGSMGALWQGVTGGLVEGCRILNIQVGGPYHDFWMQKDLIARNNFYRNVKVGPYENLGVEDRIGVSYIQDPADYVELDSLVLDGTTVKATTEHPHGLTDEDSVLIAGVEGQDADRYNGTWPITFADATNFHYIPTTTPSGAPQGTPRYATTDRQRLLDTLTYTLAGGIYVGTASTPANHGLVKGDAVFVSRASGQAHNDYFNGYHVITESDDDSFEIELEGNPNPPSQSGSSPSGYFGRLWQTGRVVIEDNVIELKAATTYWNGAFGIHLGGATAVLDEVPLYRQAIIRRNIIRFAVVGDSDPYSYGILASGCGELIVEDNVVDLERATPIVHTLCQSVKAWNNTTSAGQLIQCTEKDTGRELPELGMDVEDAAVLAF